jgi:uncharacterized protein YpiB (UPF0302 family)
MQEMAFEESQKYKEGKYILEKAKVTKVTIMISMRCPDPPPLRYAKKRFMTMDVSFAQEGTW